MTDSGVPRRQVLKGVGAGLVGPLFDVGSQTLRTVMITANRPTTYSLSVDGDLRPATLSGQFQSDGDEEIDRSGARVTVSDNTGPKPSVADATTYLGDRFEFSGTITDLTLTRRNRSTDVQFYLDEQDVSESRIRSFADRSGARHTLMITANGRIDYSLTVNGTLKPQTLAGDFAAEDEDTPIQSSSGILTAMDETGPNLETAGPNIFLGDRYLVNGSVTDFSVSAKHVGTDVNFYVDGSYASAQAIRHI